VPRAACCPTLSVSTEEPDAVIEDGLKLADVREGRPEALKLTVPVKPPDAAVVTVNLPLLPRRMV